MDFTLCQSWLGRSGRSLLGPLMRLGGIERLLTMNGLFVMNGSRNSLAAEKIYLGVGKNGLTAILTLLFGFFNICGRPLLKLIRVMGHLASLARVTIL